MTEKEEKLILIDIAARVPYGVMVEQTLFSSTVADKNQRLKSVQENNCVKLYWNKYNLDDFVPIDCIKPYLRPMSSMRDDERKEYKSFIFTQHHEWDGHGKSTDYVETDDVERYVTWLNAHHFDYRGLIPMGLALEAPEDMYKTE